MGGRWLFNCCHQNWSDRDCYEFSVVDGKFSAALKLILVLKRKTEKFCLGWWDRTHENFTHGFAYHSTMMKLMLLEGNSTWSQLSFNHKSRPQILMKIYFLRIPTWIDRLKDAFLLVHPWCLAWDFSNNFYDALDILQFTFPNDVTINRSLFFPNNSDSPAI